MVATKQSDFREFAILIQTISHWGHLVSFALWIGAMWFFLSVFAPAAKKLPPAGTMLLLNQGGRNLQSLWWLVIGVLALTGLIYLAFRGAAVNMTLGSTYTLLLGLKLFLFPAMVVHQSIQCFKYAPGIESLTAEARPARQDWPEDPLSGWNRWFILLKINGVIGPLALFVAVGLQGL